MGLNCGPAEQAENSMVCFIETMCEKQELQYLIRITTFASYTPPYNSVEVLWYYVDCPYVRPSIHQLYVHPLFCFHMIT